MHMYFNFWDVFKEICNQMHRFILYTEKYLPLFYFTHIALVDGKYKTAEQIDFLSCLLLNKIEVGQNPSASACRQVKITLYILYICLQRSDIWYYQTCHIHVFNMIVLRYLLTQKCKTNTQICYIFNLQFILLCTTNTQNVIEWPDWIALIFFKNFL
jgi:uncharacterized membrane protein YjdF